MPPAERNSQSELDHQQMQNNVDLQSLLSGLDKGKGDLNELQQLLL